MEELANQLGKSVLQDSSHSSYYKIRGEEKINQHKRRSDLLKLQKEKQVNQYDANRGILDLIKENEQSSLKNLSTTKGYVPSVQVPGFNSNKRLYADTLMLSEWMIFKPTDFETDWTVLACPKGKRVLVVATGGRTKAYSKYGHFIEEWNSCLPGGYQDYDKFTVLDCFMTKKGVYVLDVLAWSNISLVDCESECRYFWLKSKFMESNYVEEKLDNTKAIYLIERCDCSKTELSNLLMKHPVYKKNSPAIDGLLFYHKKGFYIKGYSPLVVWLFPYMVHEVIADDIVIHNNYLNERAEDYTDYLSFIEQFDRELENKKCKAEKYVNNKSNSSLNSSGFNFELNDPSNYVECFHKADTETDIKCSNKTQEMDVVADVSADSAVGFMDDSITQ